LIEAGKILVGDDEFIVGDNLQPKYPDWHVV
jgi:hypothetical protein